MLYTGNYAVNTGQYDNKLKYLNSDAETVRGRRSEYRNYYQSLPCLTKIMKDGWTVVTEDGKLSAKWEHTVAITEQSFEILTLREEEK